MGDEAGGGGAGDGGWGVGSVTDSPPQATPNVKTIKPINNTLKIPFMRTSFHCQS
jgi:hypothetical protein